MCSVVDMVWPTSGSAYSAAVVVVALEPQTRLAFVAVVFAVVFVFLRVLSLPVTFGSH